MAGYIGQIFNSVQGEGIHVGKRQVLIRFANCSLDCVYCDSERFRNPRPEMCEVETRPGSMRFKKVPNPMTGSQVLKYVEDLKTPDLHSVSLTGGEPLLAGDFLVEVARSCKKSGYKIYLETNGSDRKNMTKVLKHVDIAAIDLKLPAHLAVPVERWPGLFEEELACVKAAVESGAETFVKIVILPSTKREEIGKICKRLSSVKHVPVVLQPVTPAGKIRKTPSLEQMFRLSETAADAGVENVAIIPQVHKLIGAL